VASRHATLIRSIITETLRQTLPVISNLHFNQFSQDEIRSMKMLRVQNESVDSSIAETIESPPYTIIDDAKFPKRFMMMPKTRVSMKMPIHVECQKVLALFVTGAHISAISSRLLNTLQSAVHRRGYCEAFQLSLAVVEKEPNLVSVNEYAEVVLSINNDRLLWRFFVVPNLSNALLFGLDFMFAYDVRLAARNEALKFGVLLEDEFPNKAENAEIPMKMPQAFHTLRVKSPKPSQVAKQMNARVQSPTPVATSRVKTPKRSRVYTTPESRTPVSRSRYSHVSLPSTKPSQTQSEPSLPRVQVTRTCFLKPRAITRVKVYSDRSVNGNIAISPRRAFEYSKHVLIGRQIINMTNGEGYAFIVNMTTSALKLQKDRFIGTCETLQADQVLCNLDELEIRQKVTLEMNAMTKVASEKPGEDENFDLHDIQIPEYLDATQKRRLKALLMANKDVLCSADNKLHTTNLAEHYIDTGDDAPVRHRPYRCSFADREIISQKVKELMDKSIIEPSSSPWSSPVVLVRQRDKIRFCIDFRRLNAVTKKDSYPMPRIDDSLDQLKGATIFSNLDCDAAYHQVPIHPSHQEKTAFVTPDGLYQFKTMPFGLCNAPATFSRLIDTVLAPFKWTIALVYLDDIICYSKNFDEHMEHLSLILAALRKARLTLKPSKCHFATKELKFLGHIVSADGIRTNPQLTKAVQQFEKPKHYMKDAEKAELVHSFVSLCSYYRKFVPNFSKIAKPLHELTDKTKEFKWTENAERAWNTLVEKLTTSPILGYWDHDAETEIHTDACKKGLGATLVQKQNNVERVIAYASRTLMPYEVNYCSRDLEALGILWAIDHFKHYVKGRKFTVVTDHHSLCSILKTKDPQDRQARWLMKLQPYDFEIKHRSGRVHTDVDPLSRHPVLTNSHLSIGAMSIHDDVSEWQQAQKEDKVLGPIIDEIERRAVEPIHPSKLIDDPIADYEVRIGLLCKSNKDEDAPLWLICVPREKVPDVLHDNKDEDAPLWLICVPREKVPDVLHDVHVIKLKHQGRNKTYEFLRQFYTWNKMYTHCLRYCQGCVLCQVHNRRNFPTKGELKPQPPPETVFHTIGIDFQGPFASTYPGQNKYIFVAVDHLSRFTIAVPTKSNDHKAAIQALLKHVFFIHSPPAVILSDKGSCFTCAEFRKFCDDNNVKFKTTSSYMPNTNGICERKNGSIKSILAKHVAKNHKDWDAHLPSTIYALNIAKHKVTKEIPFYLVFGRNPHSVPFQNDIQSQHEPVAERTRHKRALNLARQRTIEFQNMTKRAFDAKHKPADFKIGDLVLLENHNFTSGPVRKFIDEWIGPFEIIKKVGDNNYEVLDRRKKPNPNKPTRNVSARQIKLYYLPFTLSSSSFSSSDLEPEHEPIMSDAPNIAEQKESSTESSWHTAVSSETISEPDENPDAIPPPAAQYRRSTRATKAPTRLVYCAPGKQAINFFSRARPKFIN